MTFYSPDQGLQIVRYHGFFLVYSSTIRLTVLAYIPITNIPSTNRTIDPNIKLNQRGKVGRVILVILSTINLLGYLFDNPGTAFLSMTSQTVFVGFLILF